MAYAAKQLPARNNNQTERGVVMGLFNFCPNDPAVFTGLHQWTAWTWTGRTNKRRCINCGYVQKR